MLKNLYTRFLSKIHSLFTAIFGDFSWQAPAWIGQAKLKAKTHPKQFWQGVTVIAVLCLLSLLSYHWYHHRPQPQQIIAQITAPHITPNEKSLVPDNLNIEFGVVVDGTLNTRSVAPLNAIGKPIKQGVKLTPQVSGTWSWETDSHLIFIPDKDWPAGQTYTVEFDRDFFAANASPASLKNTFATQPFEAKITDFKFYQDPVNAASRKAIAAVTFNYPVDATTLQNKILLTWQTLKNGKRTPPLKFTLQYDEHHRTAYIHSEILTLPDTERYIDLVLAKGIKPISGSSVTNTEEKASVLIPDAISFFKVKEIESNIVRNQKDQPEQVLAIETTLGVTQAELNKHIHVYVLPKDYPATAVEAAKINYSWSSPGEVTDPILSISTPVTLNAIAADRDFATLHSYQYKAPSTQYLYIKIDKGTPSFGGFTLANDYKTILQVPTFPQEISFLHKGALLALGTEEKLSVLVRGIGAVKFEAARVLANDINHLVTQTSGNFSNPYFINYDFNQNNISEIFSQVQQFDATDPGKQQYTALDLNQFLTSQSNKGNPLGLFLLKAKAWNVEKDIPLGLETNRLILITDLGLIVKDNVNGTHDVFVQSLTSGLPVDQAQVSVLGKNGLALVTRATNAQGQVNLPILSDFINEREPVAYLITHNKDVAFMPYRRSDRQLNYSRFDVGGISSYSENQAALTAYVFTERGIYRPGDTVHLGMIVKQPYAMPQPAGLPLELIITDSRGATVKDEKLTLDDTGFLTVDFTTSKNAPTGQYQASLYIIKDNHPSSLIGSTPLTIAEFLPDRLRITAALSAPPSAGWISPADLKANIGLWNLYGAPAVDRTITGKLVLAPKAVNFPAFPNYIFVDPLLNPNTAPKTFTDTLKDTHTNSQGEAQFDLNLERFDKATYQLTLYAEGFEAAGGRSVATQTSALVSPLPYLVGYKADTSLAYIKQDSTANVNFIAVNPRLEQQALSNLKIQLFKQHPISTLVKQDNGTYQYQSVIQTTEVSTKPFSIAQAGINYTLATRELGDFLVVVLNAEGTELSRFKYSVVGTGQEAMPRNAELNIKLNKAEFAPGEEIELQITAPYTGTGLITIERDKVHAYQWFKTSTTSSLQKIRLPADFQGNGYVNVAFVRDINSPEIFMSPLSYSVIPFSVTHSDRDIKVTLSAPQSARPGEALPITYQTDRPAKIVVFAVDQGILQITQYKTPNPQDYFFQKHALEVDTLQIVDQILPKFIAERELSAAGGDDGEAALRKNLNPFKRKTEAAVVFWSGIIDADSIPKTLNYTVPDYFSGTLRIMAVAVSNNAVGSAQQETKVKGNFVINPNVPTFAAPGDEFEVTASIANNIEGSGDKANITVNLAAQGLEVIGDTKQTLVIPEGQERSVQYKIKVADKLGSASLVFSASQGDKTSHMTSTLSVRPLSPYYTGLISGYARDNKTLTLTRALYPEYRDVIATASSNPLILVSGLERYTNEYPYGCTEQLVSKAFPLLAMANQPWFQTNFATISDHIKLTIQMLAQRQLSSGGFSYWPETGSAENNDFASVYAMHFLTEARLQGYAIPADLLSNGIGFLRELAMRDSANITEARLQAYAIYILTRNEIVTTNYVTHLQSNLEKLPVAEWQKDITTIYLAAIYQMLKNTAEAERLIAYFKPSNKQVDDSSFYSQSIANAQYLYLVTKHFPQRLQRIDTNFILSLIDSMNEDSINTLLSSYASLGLASYGQFYEIANDTPISIQETLNDGQTKGLSSATGLYQTAKIDINAKEISFTNPGKQAYFYQLIQSGFDKTLPSAAINQGLEAYREFRDTENNIISHLRLGDEIIVNLRARTTDNKYHNNIAIVDLLPGGFEVVRDSIHLANMDYADVREDRVIFFGTVGPESAEMSYRIKATNEGDFTVPPLLATAMYNPSLKALGLTSSMHVGARD